MVLDSDEHDEEGHIVEDAETRVNMVRKRLLLKKPRIREEMEPPFLFGDPKPETLLVGWGSTLGLLKEAVEEMAREAAWPCSTSVRSFPCLRPDASTTSS